MLSQRISSLVAQYALGDSDARKDLVTAIDQFESAHQKLLNGDDVLKLPALTHPTLRNIYFTGSLPLNEAVKAYIADARALAAMNPDDSRLTDRIGRIFLAARSPLLNKLDEVVKVHQQ